MKLHLDLSKSAIFCTLATALVIQSGPLATRVLAGTNSAPPTVAAELTQNQEPVIDQKAADLLRAMSDLLGVCRTSVIGLLKTSSGNRHNPRLGVGKIHLVFGLWARFRGFRWLTAQFPTPSLFFSFSLPQS